MSPEFLDVDGIRTRYVTQGSGSELLLLHGWGCSIETLTTTIVDDLSKSHSVTVLDLPGHGSTTMPPEPWGTERFAQFILRFMDMRGLSHPSILGHSVGGRFAIQLAATHPGRVSKLILAASAGIKPRRPFSYYLKVGLAKIGRFSARYLGSAGEVLRKRIYDWIASPDYKTAGALRPSFIKIISEDLRGLLPSIRTKTLLIWGRDDRETPLQSGELMHSLISDSELVVLDGAGHYLFLDDPMRFLLHVKKFLRD